MANYTANNEEKYQIVCPYCFNEAAGGKPFSHKDVHFRAETYYANPGAIEQALGTSKIDIEMMSNAKERGNAMRRQSGSSSGRTPYTISFGKITTVLPSGKAVWTGT